MLTDSKPPEVERDSPPRARKASRLMMSAETSTCWVLAKVKVLATRMLNVVCHGSRQLLRSIRWPRCALRHGWLLMKASSVDHWAGFARVISWALSGTYT